MAPGKAQPATPAARPGRLAEFLPDARNVNTGTPRGLSMIEESLRTSGAGRSLLADKHGRLVAGNKTQAAAVAAGMDDVIVVPSDGTKLVVVQRTDLDLDTAEGRRLALADNRTQQVSYHEDTALLAQLIAEMPAAAAGLWSEDEMAAVLAAANGTGAGDGGPTPDEARRTLAERFLIPPFSVLDARQGYWQARKQAWLTLGIRSEVGRGEAVPGSNGVERADVGQQRCDAAPAVEPARRRKTTAGGRAKTGVGGCR